MVLDVLALRVEGQRTLGKLLDEISAFAISAREFAQYIGVLGSKQEHAPAFPRNGRPPTVTQFLDFVLDRPLCLQAAGLLLGTD
jgi:hypothetical protein